MNTLTAVQVTLGIILILLVLAQNRGAGMGSQWGGSGEFYVTRRGLEKLLFRATILVAVLFIVISALAVLA